MIDAGAAVIAFFLATAVFSSLTNQLLIAIAAGAGASVLLRTEVLMVGKGGKQQPIGLAQPYHHFRDGIDRRILDVDAKNETRWINRTVVPRLSTLSPEKIDTYTRQYFLSLDTGTDRGASGALTERQKELIAIQAEVALSITKLKKVEAARPNTTDIVEPRREIANKLLRGGCKGALELLLEEGDQGAGRRGASPDSGRRLT